MRKKPRFTSRGQFFLLQFFTPEGSERRAGVLVSKKVALRATERNRIRRAALSYIAKTFSKLASGNFLFVANPRAKDVSSEELASDIKKLIDTL